MNNDAYRPSYADHFQRCRRHSVRRSVPVLAASLALLACTGGDARDAEPTRFGPAGCPSVAVLPVILGYTSFEWIEPDAVQWLGEFPTIVVYQQELQEARDFSSLARAFGRNVRTESFEFAPGPIDRNGDAVVVIHDRDEGCNLSIRFTSESDQHVDELVETWATRSEPGQGA